MTFHLYGAYFDLDDPRPELLCPWLSKGFVIPTPQRFLFVLSALSHPMMQQKVYHGEALKRESQMRGKSGKGKFQCDVPRSSCQNCQYLMSLVQSKMKQICSTQVKHE